MCVALERVISCSTKRQNSSNSSRDLLIFFVFHFKVFKSSGFSPPPAFWVAAPLFIRFLFWFSWDNMAQCLFYPWGFTSLFGVLLHPFSWFASSKGIFEGDFLLKRQKHLYNKRYGQSSKHILWHLDFCCFVMGYYFLLEPALAHKFCFVWWSIFTTKLLSFTKSLLTYYLGVVCDHLIFVIGIEFMRHWVFVIVLKK